MPHIPPPRAAIATAIGKAEEGGWLAGGGRRRQTAAGRSEVRVAPAGDSGARSESCRSQGRHEARARPRPRRRDTASRSGQGRLAAGGPFAAGRRGAAQRCTAPAPPPQPGRSRGPGPRRAGPGRNVPVRPGPGTRGRRGCPRRRRGTRKCRWRPCRPGPPAVRERERLYLSLSLCRPGPPAV